VAPTTIYPYEGDALWCVIGSRTDATIRHIQRKAMFQIACPAQTPISKLINVLKEGRPAPREFGFLPVEWECLFDSMRSIARSWHNLSTKVNSSE